MCEHVAVKKTSSCTKKSSGFVANRLPSALFREAASIVQKGLTSPQDIDRVMKDSFRRRYAAAVIFELADIAGLEVGVEMANQIFSDLKSSPEPPQLLQEKIERGELGIKTGKGFYHWTSESAQALKQKIAAALIKILKQYCIIREDTHANSSVLKQDYPVLLFFSHF